MNDVFVEAKVSDNGVGIPYEVINRTFEPFFTARDAGCGTGFGLYVTSMLVKRHHGTIDVDSEIGKGTTFTLRFPIWG
jgi:signal transduction histidine kinase